MSSERSITYSIVMSGLTRSRKESLVSALTGQTVRLDKAEGSWYWQAEPPKLATTDGTGSYDVVSRAFSLADRCLYCTRIGEVDVIELAQRINEVVDHAKYAPR